MNEIAVKVRLSLPFSWQYGYWQAWEDVQSLLSEWGEFTYQVSEIHVCVDVAGYPLDSLHAKNFTRRGHVVRWHQEDILILDIKPESDPDDCAQSIVSVRYWEQEGLAFSPTAAHSVTIYNKLREICLKSRDKPGSLISGKPTAGTGLIL